MCSVPGTEAQARLGRLSKAMMPLSWHLGCPGSAKQVEGTPHSPGLEACRLGRNVRDEEAGGRKGLGAPWRRQGGQDWAPGTGGRDARGRCQGLGGLLSKGPGQRCGGTGESGASGLGRDLEHLAPDCALTRSTG